MFVVEAMLRYVTLRLSSRDVSSQAFPVFSVSSPRTINARCNGESLEPRLTHMHTHTHTLHARLTVLLSVHSALLWYVCRYAILAPKAIPAGFMDGRKACELLLAALQLETNEYRLGNSKVRKSSLLQQLVYIMYVYK